MEYTPYGELWIERVKQGVEKVPYRFTGKEFDEETGLYYYGARYLDPRTSRWLSADPAMGEYVPGAPVNDEARKRNGNLPGMGGVFNLVNLHTYHYAGNNPVRIKDPDGRLDIDGAVAHKKMFEERRLRNNPDIGAEITIIRYKDSYNTTDRRNREQRGQDYLILKLTNYADNTTEVYTAKVQTVSNEEGSSGSTLAEGSFYTVFGDAGFESKFESIVLTPANAELVDGRVTDNAGFAKGNWGRIRFHDGDHYSAGCIVGDEGHLSGDIRGLVGTLERWGIARGEYIFTRIIEYDRGR
jgi:RHS repeat-associated protein